MQIIHVVVPDGGDAEVKKIELYLKKLLRSLDVIIRAGRAFLDSRFRVPGVLGPWARGNAIFF